MAFKLSRRSAAGIVFFFVFGNYALSAAEPSQTPADATAVLQAYLRASYARDFVSAYRLISAADHRVRDLNRYVRQRGPFHGFALEIAKSISEAIKMTVTKSHVSPDRTQMVVKYRAPDVVKLAPSLFQWDVYRINSLPAAERSQILTQVEKKKRTNDFEMTEGEETFEMVQEDGAWRIFLNWAAGVRVTLRLETAKAADLDVRLSKNEFVMQPDELFEVALKIRNPTSAPITARIAHIVDPNAVADYLDFVQCGFLQPVTIPATAEQEFAGTYLLRGSLPEGVRQLSLTYDFRLLK